MKKHEIMASAGKHGLLHAREEFSLNHEMHVYLDDEDVTDRCQCADDQFGFVVLYTTHPATFDPVTKRAKRELKFGRVEMFACEKEP